MKKIIIKELKIHNFKCYAEVNFKFDEGKNVLMGETGCGKTTIRDAYLWCFGFDCDFAPKIDDTLVENIDTLVEVLMSIDSIDYSFKRLNKQKWTNSGQFAGNDSKFYIDDISKTATNFKAELASIFEVNDYNNVRLLLDLSAFNNDNGTRWTWKERRNFLFGLLNIDLKIKDIEASEDFDPIREYLSKGLDETEIASSLNAKKKDIDNSLKRNKVLLDDKRATIKEYSIINYDVLVSERARLEQDIEDLTQGQLQKRIELQKQIKDLEFSIANCDQRKEVLLNSEQQLETASQNLFSTTLSDKCPTCGTKLDNKKMLTLKATFELDKMQKLSELHDEAENCRLEAQKLEERITSQKLELNRLTGQLDQYFKGSGAKAEFDKSMQDLKQQIYDINQELYKGALIDKLSCEIENIKEENKKLLNQQKELLKQTEALKLYVEKKIEIVSRETKNNFDGLAFKFFKMNTANAENEYQPTCECLLNGVVYKNLSQGQKIIADFKMNCGLQKLLDVNVPQFIDNKQDNTFDMISDSQQIDLVTCKESNIKASFIKGEEK